MQKWPYADFTHVNVEYFRSMPQKSGPLQKWEFLTVEAVFVSENTVQFFDHYVKEYKSRRNELDEYLQKLSADGWKLVTTGNFAGNKYQFRRYQFRRTFQ